MKKSTLLALSALVLSGCFGKFKSPQELAQAAGAGPGKTCDIQYISGWEGGAIQYKKQSGYAPAAEVMARKWGDCKGFAVVAKETLEACGIKNHIVQLTQEEGPGHVITVFTLPSGERGYIDAGNSKIYPASKPWKDIIYDVPPGRGHWEANFAVEAE